MRERTHVKLLDSIKERRIFLIKFILKNFEKNIVKKGVHESIINGYKHSSEFFKNRYFNLREQLSEIDGNY
jgi:hypothetical protein